MATLHATPDQTAAAPRRGSPRTAGERGADAGALALVDSTAAAFGLLPSALHQPSRGPAPTAFARQVAMYLAHVHLGLTMRDAGGLFGRDRTTAAHACRRVEDRRDDAAVDRLVEGIAAAIDRATATGAGR
ncbi:helix-turn-helix domain-containing protein [Methylobrevis albus]|uniref:Chromosomal replication initiator DnaA C-terminal domain-containing protein n=1 Tax=Methylobrevis albus TaxID=2793297 RepID=A0A931HYR4_9HYPH|nr:helix-turn-helix domain-containing protein [Methylobrevis albus]MBH0237167.1 hypothetical protein [Methylobrevis albus]